MAKISTNNLNLGIVILNYNSYADSKNCIESILPQLKNPDALVLIDNDSKDESYNQLKAEFQHSPKIHFLKNDKNLGYAQGNNSGIAYLLESNYAFICICNPDITVQPHTLEIMTHFLSKHEKVCCAGPLVLNIDGTPDKNCARGQVNVFQLLIVTTLLRKLDFWGSNKRYYSEYDYSKSRQVYMISGSFMMLKRQVFEKLGGLDPHTFLYHEEAVLSHKIREQNLGYIYIVPEAKVIHHAKSSNAYDKAQQTKHYAQSEHYYLAEILNTNRIATGLFALIRRLQYGYWLTRAKMFKTTTGNRF